MKEHGVYINWKPEYDLGIPIIDEQHRGIVSIINSLYYGMQNNHINDLLEPIIGMMQDYTLVHFQIEETFLKASAYPDTKNHLDLHQELITKLRIIGNKSMLDKEPYQLMEFLKKWWIHHICVADVTYKDYVKGAA